MDDGSWIKLAFQAYQNHSVAIKQISRSLDCYDNHQWAMVTIGECIADRYQWLGFIMGLVSTIIFLPARHFQIATYFRPRLHSHWSQLLVITWILNTLSLVGAVLAMQLFQVILFDLAVTLADSVQMVFLTITAVSNMCNRRAGYQELQQSTNGDNKGVKKSCFLLCCKSWCLVTGLVCVPVLLTTYNSVAKVDRSLDVNEFHEWTKNKYYTHALINSCGFLLGGVACFGQWALQFYILAVTRLQMNDVRIPTRSFKPHDQPNTPSPAVSKTLSIVTCLLMASDLLYVTGILFHSRGWMVAMVSLPWAMQRSVHAGFQSLNLCPSLLACQDDFIVLGSRQNDDVMSLMESDRESESNRSSSDSSNILWDRQWKLPGVKDTFVYYPRDDSERVLDLARQKLVSGDVTTSIESDWSTTSIEQELEWEDEAMLSKSVSNFPQDVNGQQKTIPPRLPPLILSSTPTESRVERVRSWVSNSTPEEEKTPCLTAALDLDHNSNCYIDPFCDEDSHALTGYVPHRKYSL